MNAFEAVVKPGQIVRVRSRQYLVDDVRRPQHSSQHTVVSLSCLDDDAQGQPLEVLWETELDAEILAPHDWKSVAQRGFDSPRMFSAFLHTQRWNLVTSTDAKLFQAPHRAGIEVMSYQVEPLRKALALPRVNLFIADDVGLGKTIEAGLIFPRVAAAAAREARGGGCSAVGGRAVAAGTGTTLRLAVHDPRSRLCAASSQRARPQRQPVAHAHPLHRLACAVA
jgi:hypothetical protein